MPGTRRRSLDHQVPLLNPGTPRQILGYQAPCMQPSVIETPVLSIPTNMQSFAAATRMIPAPQPPVHPQPLQYTPVAVQQPAPLLDERTNASLRNGRHWGLTDDDVEDDKPALVLKKPRGHYVSQLWSYCSGYP